MANNVIAAPGKDLESFLKELAYDLKRRKIEYLNVGFLNEENVPIGMIEIKGQSSWVGFDVNQIIEVARKHKAYGICFVHNHPVASKESPDLTPSQNDFLSLRKILDIINDCELKFFGSWITSNSHLTEILNYYSKNSRNKDAEQLFSDVDISTFLTIQLRETYDTLTKSNLIQLSWFRLFTWNIAYSLFVFQIVRIKYYGKTDSNYSFRIEVRNEGLIHVATFTPEEALRAENAYKELIIAIEKISMADDEYTELRIDLSENLKCIAFKNDLSPNGLIQLNFNNWLVTLYDFKILLSFFEKGFAKIDYLMNQEEPI